MTVFTNAQGKMSVGPLSDNRDVLRRQIAMITLRFGLEGRKITKCPPAFAAGCETPVNVRGLIRRDLRAGH